MSRKVAFLLLAFFSFTLSFGQLLSPKNKYTRADTLRGGLRPERTHFDVLKYDLSVAVFPEKKFISGNNKITFKVLDSLPVMQLDLFANMKIDSIKFHGAPLKFQREYNAVFITFPKPLIKESIDSLDFFYSGHPQIAKRPPWDGGFIFTKDDKGKTWVSVAVQGTGASLWYPNKDTQSDEPETAEIHVTTPPDLMDVSNGRLTGKEILPDGRITWSWKVDSPINNYDLILNVGNYTHFSDKFKDLDLDYYVLPQHLKKAKEQFGEAKKMLRCFSDKFGPYPFKKDGYKLVETPYLGMEHQSAIGYGNHFENGYLGRDLSGTGVGLKWDFIIVHESAHEWFGNSITAADLADMWIHEAFASYAESVYVECRWGEKEALTYLKGLRKTMVANDSPIIGDYGVNKEGSSDMYYKGANMLHTLRSVINNDPQWWKILKDFATSFQYKITNTEAVIAFFSKASGKDLTPIFNQYLRHTQLPALQLRKKGDKILYRWKAQASNFNMPVVITVKNKVVRLHPTEEWKTLRKNTPLADIKVDTDNFYIKVTKEGVGS